MNAYRGFAYPDEARRPDSRIRMTTKKKSTKMETPDEAAAPKKSGGGGAAAAARRILEDESPQSKIAEHGETMMEGPRTAATQSARVLSEVLAERPELVVPLVAKFAKGISSSNKRVVQTSAEALPAIARIAPESCYASLRVTLEGGSGLLPGGRS